MWEPGKPGDGRPQASPWSLKRLHRLIMTSAVYRQSWARTSALHKIDPDNKLLGCMPVRRIGVHGPTPGVLQQWIDVPFSPCPASVSPG